MSTSEQHPTYRRAVRRATAAGSQATTTRGIIQYCLTHPQCWDFTPRRGAIVKSGSNRRSDLPSLSEAERENRRAHADTPFRRRLVSRLRRELSAILSPAKMARSTDFPVAACRAIVRRIRSVSPRSRQGDAQVTAVHIGGQRQDRYDFAKAHGVSMAARRGEWRVCYSASPSQRDEDHAYHTWKGSEDRVTYPGSAIKKGFKLDYHPANYETRVRSLGWLGPDGAAYYMIHETVYALPGRSWSVDADGYMVAPDGRYTGRQLAQIGWVIE
jgi:hypothetical protein